MYFGRATGTGRRQVGRVGKGEGRCAHQGGVGRGPDPPLPRVKAMLETAACTTRRLELPSTPATTPTARGDPRGSVQEREGQTRGHTMVVAAGRGGTGLPRGASAPVARGELHGEATRRADTTTHVVNHGPFTLAALWGQQPMREPRILPAIRVVELGETRGGVQGARPAPSARPAAGGGRQPGGHAATSPQAPREVQATRDRAAKARLHAPTHTTGPTEGRGMGLAPWHTQARVRGRAGGRSPSNSRTSAAAPTTSDSTTATPAAHGAARTRSEGSERVTHRVRGPAVVQAPAGATKPGTGAVGPGATTPAPSLGPGRGHEAAPKPQGVCRVPEEADTPGPTRVGRPGTLTARQAAAIGAAGPGAVQLQGVKGSGPGTRLGVPWPRP